jgi:hypothetical protein
MVIKLVVHSYLLFMSIIKIDINNGVPSETAIMSQSGILKGKPLSDYLHIFSSILYLSYISLTNGSLLKATVVLEFEEGFLLSDARVYFDILNIDSLN